MIVGYARVSTSSQSLDGQVDELEKAGCERIFTDVASGAKASRPGLEEALDHLRSGDVLTVVRIDRAGRNMTHLLALVETLEKRGVGFRSLADSIDTSSANGRLIFNIFASLATFERELIRERTNKGLDAARARGRKGGRPFKLDSEKAKLAKKLYDDKSLSVKEICAMLQITPPTLRRYVQAQS